MTDSASTSGGPAAWMQWALAPCLSLCLLLAAPFADAAPGCTSSTATTSASFGSVSSRSISGTVQSTSIPDAGVQCGGSLLNVLDSSGYIRATVSTTNSAKLTNSAGDSIPYSLYADPSYTKPITPGTAFNYYTSDVLNLLGLLGSNYASLPMYMRTTSGTYNLSAGTYSDTISVTWSWKICQAIGALGLCIPAIYNEGTFTTSFKLNLQINNDCLINADDINFGSAPVLQVFSPVTQTISVTCTKGTTYTVGLSNGSNALNGQRRMAASQHYIAYEIYQGQSGNTRWGSTAGQTRSSTTADINAGSGTGTTAQGFYYRAAILSTQAAPPQGTYTDSVLINVIF